MEAPPARRFRTPLGLFEAGLLLVVAAAGLMLLRPLPFARRNANAEKEILAHMGAVADAEDARAAGTRGPYLPLDGLVAADGALAKSLAGFTPAPAAGVLGNRSYWMAVLPVGSEGWLAAPGAGDPAFAARGYALVAWPKTGAPEVLRALAALPAAVMWQRADGMEESGDPARPPLPRACFTGTGSGGARTFVPDPPPDWVISKKRR